MKLCVEHRKTPIKEIQTCLLKIYDDKAKNILGNHIGLYLNYFHTNRIKCIKRHTINCAEQGSEKERYQLNDFGNNNVMANIDNGMTTNTIINSRTSLPSMSIALIEGFSTAAAQIHAQYSG